jgi:hypothetical protein
MPCISHNVNGFGEAEGREQLRGRPRLVLCEACPALYCAGQAGWICYPPRTRVGLMEHHIWKDVEWGLHDEDWLGPRSRMRRGTCCSDRADVARQGRRLVFCLS